MEKERMRALDQLASSQHGLVNRTQALDLGATDGELRYGLSNGRLERVHAGVYRFAGSTETWVQQVMGAVLAAGGDAVASHRTAAALWGLLSTDQVEVTVSATRLPRIQGATVHRSRDLHRDRRLIRSGVPVTTPMRAVLDLGAVEAKSVVSEALELGLTEKLFTIEAVEQHRAKVARPGRRGSGVLRDVLDDRALGAEAPDGMLEPRMAILLKEAGLPLAHFQFEVRVNGKFVARLDFAYPTERIAIEVDGWRYHHTPRQMVSDLRRQNALVLAGWTVLRFTWEDVIRRPSKVAAEIGRALRANFAA